MDLIGSRDFLKLFLSCLPSCLKNFPTGYIVPISKETYTTLEFRVTREALLTTYEKASRLEKPHAVGSGVTYNPQWILKNIGKVGAFSPYPLKKGYCNLGAQKSPLPHSSLQ